MKLIQSMVLLASLLSPLASAAETVNLDNFARASSELTVKRSLQGSGGLGKFGHFRQLLPLESQRVIRMNRDTLYSWVIFDLEKCFATLTKPELDEGRYQSVQIINLNHYSPLVAYKPGTYKLTKDLLGTRYGIATIRTGVNPSDPKDLEKVHALQDGLKFEQSCEGSLDGLTDWDVKSFKAVEQALLQIVPFQSDISRRMGPNAESVDRLAHLLGSASGWGLLPINAAKYLNAYPEKAGGITPYTLTFKKPDLDYANGGFWSITVYNEGGYIEQNPLGIYAINHRTAIPNTDGSFTIHFGGDTTETNFMPIEGISGWNYSVRLYLPRETVQSNDYQFPKPVAVVQ